MSDSPSNLNLRIAARVCELRAKLGLSLDALARKSGVSRSMLSLIERGESSPTAVVLERLAAGLGVALASLFEEPTYAKSTPDGPVSRFKDQTEWADPSSGYIRRNVSPPGVTQPLQIVEVLFPADARVSFETGHRSARIYQQIWILDGTMDITVGKERHRLDKGDCLAMELDQPVLFHNPTRKLARYAVVVASELRSRGRSSLPEGAETHYGNQNRRPARP